MSIKMKSNDPAYWMLFDGIETTPVVYSESCYICNDPEFARMGLPLCRKCPVCGGHIAADDSRCDDCGLDERMFHEISATKINKEELDRQLPFLFTDCNYEPVVPTKEQVVMVKTALAALGKYHPQTD